MRTKRAAPSPQPPTRPQPDSRRRNRPRPTPTWLKEQQELDEVAKRRVLLVLSVLSGETPVTDAIREAGISRGLYYQLETKALNAMLMALSPGSDGIGSSAEAASLPRRIADLEEKLKKAEQEKRRAERLLFLTRKVVKPGPAKLGNGGRRPRATNGQSSTKPGRRPSGVSTSAPKTMVTAPTAPSAAPTSTTSPTSSSPSPSGTAMSEG